MTSKLFSFEPFNKRRRHYVLLTIVKLKDLNIFDKMLISKGAFLVAIGSSIDSKEKTKLTSQQKIKKL